MNALSFFVSMVPRRKNRLQIVKVGGFSKLAPDAKGAQSQETLASLIAPYRPPVPLNGPVRLDVSFVMPIPSGWPEWKRAAALEGRLHHVSRPDRGNLLKLCEDAMTGPFLTDDSRIVGGVVEKIYGVTPGYQIRLQELEQAQKPVRVKKPKRGAHVAS